MKSGEGNVVPRMRLKTAGTLAAAALVCTTAPGRGAQAQADRFPPKVSDVVRQLKLSEQEQMQMLQGQPVTRLLETDPSKEVSVFGAVWIKASVASYLAAVRQIEKLEKGEGFLVTKRISSPPRLEDFDQLTLPADDIGDLKKCKVGSCEVKMGEAALMRIQKEVDWSKPAANTEVERIMREMALSYVTSYLEGGNAKLAVYRDSGRPTFTATEFASMIDRMPALTEHLPDVKRYLLGFPTETLANSESFLYWQNVKFGLKPTIRINHLTIADEKTHAVVASKMLYATHYFWTALELRVLVPDPGRGEGFWFVNVNRSRSDGLSGFVGTLLRGKVRGEAQKGMESALRAIKQNLERS